MPFGIGFPELLLIFLATRQQAAVPFIYQEF